jgi:hypothetical protein
MTSFKATKPITLGRDFFDSAETRLLSMAFAKAWAFVEFDPMLEVLDPSERQSRLARCLMILLKQGETDPTPLANSAIKMLRRNRQSEVRNLRAQTSSAKTRDESRIVPFGRA